MPKNLDIPASPSANSDAVRFLAEEIRAMAYEVNLLSGRVELTMRLLARIVAKMDPGLLDDPLDPEVKRRSDLLGKTVITKLKTEALSQASSDPEAFDRLQRYFKDIP